MPKFGRPKVYVLCSGIYASAQRIRTTGSGQPQGMVLRTILYAATSPFTGIANWRGKCMWSDECWEKEMIQTYVLLGLWEVGLVSDGPGH
jgi:hypothetical protein